MQAYEPNTLLFDNSLATMGGGLPSKTTTCIFHPKKKVVAICGGGGFMLNFQTRFQSFFTLGPKVKTRILDMEMESYEPKVDQLC
jgi:thiamine pyrophosphate-dependent acetolactate synthase large subunit-like protein